jgi:two-component system chemotaxis response regulator CheY
MRTIVERSLRQAGLDLSPVMEAGNGAEALAILDTHPIDLILSDINMPVMDSLEFVRQQSRRVRGIAVCLRAGKNGKNLSIEDEQNDDAGHDTWGAIGVRTVSQALAQRHVLGVAGMIEHSLGLSSVSGTSGAGTPQAASPGENNSCLPLKISLKSSDVVPMNTPEALEGALWSSHTEPRSGRS